MVTINELKKFMKTPAMKESLKINRIVLKSLRNMHSKVPLKTLKKIVSLVPDYNPKDLNDAILIAKKLHWKYIMTGQLGGVII